MKSFLVIFLGLLVLCQVEAFVLDHHSNRNARLPISSLAASSSDNHNENARRQALDRLVTFTGVAAASVLLAPSYAYAADAEQEGAMYSPKFVQTYDDFKESPEGWSYREVTPGKGDAATKGDRVVFDWVSYVALRYVALRYDTIRASSFVSASEDYLLLRVSHLFLQTLQRSFRLSQSG
jgi:hypothetical protein